MQEKQRKFPEGFFWGSSMSSHQVEGGNVNDWTEWERSEKRLLSLKKNGDLDRHGFDNFISGKAAKHFEMYKEDYEIAKELGHNALRISLEWSRIEPKQGEFSKDAFGHYARMIRKMREYGIEPLVTLWHWTVPLWFRDKGGWENPEAPKYFENFSRHVIKKLGSEVKYWIILNEPELYAAHSYLFGYWPPQKKNPIAYLKVLRNLARAHRLAYGVIHEEVGAAQVGIAKNNVHFTAHGGLFLNRLNVKLAEWWWNDHFLKRVMGHLDFIGLNYYFRNKLHFGRIKNENKQVSDLGWELYPEGVYHVLKDLSKYKKPVYITENGLADAGDKNREWFIREILTFVHKAIEEGVDVRGYLHWSLLDNFEWDKGFWPRFGLVEVDYSTQKRKPRKSAEFYARIIKNNGL